MSELLKAEETVPLWVIFRKYHIRSGIVHQINWLNDGQLQGISQCINIEKENSDNRVPAADGYNTLIIQTPFY